jgi:hypothetical protein
MAAAKRVIINVRVSDEVAQAIDSARAGQSRASWVAGAIEMALGVEMALGNVPAEPQPGKKRVQETGRCPHPRARVIKGFCYACGMPSAI